MIGRLPAPTLRGYQLAYLGPDLLAGLTLVAIAVPEQMATARLAGMPAVAGLDAFLAGAVLYALLGRNGRVSVGADSTIAPVLGSGVAALAAVGTARYGHLIALLAVMVGVLVGLSGLLRLGWVAKFLSAPVITGVLGGIAVEIVVKQLPGLLGITAGGESTVGRLRSVVDHLGRTNGWALGIGLGVLGFILAGERLNRRVPWALLASVGAVAAVAGVGLVAHGVHVVGRLPGGLPALAWPSGSWTDLTRLIAPALTAAFLCLAQTAATARLAGPGPASAADFNQDLVAVGAGSIGSGLIGSFAVNTSPPRTQVLTSSGGRTQVAGLTAAGVVLALTVLGPGLLRNLPQAALSGILLFVASRLFRIGEMRTILAFDPIEFGLCVLTLLGVALIGIEQGVIIAILLSLAQRLRLSVRPRDAVLGREPGTDHWIPTDTGAETEPVSGVLVYMIYAPLWYANADYVRMRITQLIDGAPSPIHAVVLDADPMSDIDYTGAQAFQQLVHGLKERNIKVVVARASHLVHHDLKHSGVLALIGPDQVYYSVDAAVRAVSAPP